MEKRNQVAVGSRPGLGVDQLEALSGEPVQLRLDVFACVRNMMEPGSPPVEESGHGALRTRGFQELEHAHERDPNPLALDLFRWGTLCARHAFVNGRGTLYRSHRDPDVMNGERQFVAVPGRCILKVGHNGNVSFGRGVHGASGNAFPQGAIMAENGNLLTVTDDNFADQIEGSEGLTVIDFWATWCGPCRLIAPIMEELAEEYEAKGVKVGKLDVDENPNVAARFGVRSIPSVLFFKDGEHVDTIVGAVPKPHLVHKIEEHAGA